MTVCIAARSRDGYIFGVADRMVTAGDIEFEPASPKILSLTSSIFVLTSDEDAALHSEILRGLNLFIHATVQANPSNWLDVEYVANTYLQFRNEAKRKRAERDILFPLGLDSNTFVSRQHEMNPEFITGIANQLINYKLPSLSAIFCGIDLTGPHIYVAHDNDIGCYDGIGFAAIGAGASHANSQFMLHGHTPTSTSAETAFLTHLAKKRAEVAPGVGSHTDTLLITSIGISSTWHTDLIKNLDAAYRRMASKEKAAQGRAKQEIDAYVKKIQSEAAAAAALENTKQETDKPVGKGDPSE